MKGWNQTLDEEKRIVREAIRTWLERICTECCASATYRRAGVQRVSGEAHEARHVTPFH